MILSSTPSYRPHSKVTSSSFDSSSAYFGLNARLEEIEDTLYKAEDSSAFFTGVYCITIPGPPP